MFYSIIILIFVECFSIKTVLYYINICLFLKLIKNIQYSRYMWLEQNKPAIQGEAQKDYLTVGL